MNKLPNLLLVLSFSLSISTFSQEYVYLVKEQREVQPLAKLISGLTNNIYDLSLFECSTDNHKKLFTTFSSVNNRYDSLKIKDSSGTYTYKDGEIYKRNGKIKKYLSTFLSTVKKTLNEIKSYRLGATLIEKLQSSAYVVYIQKGLPMFKANYPETPQLKKENNYSMALMALQTKTYPILRLPLDQIGTGGVIQWNPDQKVSRRESDGELRTTSPAITLAHEMYHAYDSIRGYLSSILVLGKGGFEQQAIQEYRAVYFENMLRREMGLKYAKKYSSSDDSPGSMLDKNNEPYFISAGCINL